MYNNTKMNYTKYYVILFLYFLLLKIFQIVYNMLICITYFYVQKCGFSFAHI
jgi:hypothetical protein